MTGIQGSSPSDVSALTSLEEQLAAQLYVTADEISRAECFDDEQRSEVYTILETLQADSQAHRAAVKLISHRITGSMGNA
jgi:hypothetical protein